MRTTCLIALEAWSWWDMRRKILRLGSLACCSQLWTVSSEIFQILHTLSCLFLLWMTIEIIRNAVSLLVSMLPQFGTLCNLNHLIYGSIHPWSEMGAMFCFTALYAFVLAYWTFAKTIDLTAATSATSAHDVRLNFNLKSCWRCLQVCCRRGGLHWRWYNKLDIIIQWRVLFAKRLKTGEVLATALALIVLWI